MTSDLLKMPEILGLTGDGGLIRIPQQLDVPITARVRRILDTPAVQRLKRISQLGLVGFVYPAATHNRFEHSLGVYRNALLFLQQLARFPVFNQAVSCQDAEIFILAALLHDVGHWSFCHPIEDLGLPSVPSHETFGQTYLIAGELAQRIRDDWNIEPSDVVDLINKRYASPGRRILGTMLSGPIDIDKMDYLYRDSLHAGVPYGQNFDAARLVRSLCLNAAGDGLAITNKGKTAAEMMVFARYVMFSEVYWHHAVRSATAMFQRTFYLWYQQQSSSLTTSELSDCLDRLFRCGEPEMIDQLTSCNLSQLQSHAPAKTQVTDRNPQTYLASGLFGSHRRLFKRLISFNFVECEEIYAAIAHRPYPWLVERSERLAAELSRLLGTPLAPHRVLIDAPPVGLEVQFDVEVFFQQENRYVALGDVSPVVKTLAQRQFDDFVKQVRVFVDPQYLDSIRQIPDWRSVLQVLLRD